MNIMFPPEPPDPMNTPTVIDPNLALETTNSLQFTWLLIPLLFLSIALVPIPIPLPYIYYTMVMLLMYSNPCPCSSPYSCSCSYYFESVSIITTDVPVLNSINYYHNPIDSNNHHHLKGHSDPNHIVSFFNPHNNNLQSRMFNFIDPLLFSAFSFKTRLLPSSNTIRHPFRRVNYLMVIIWIMQIMMMEIYLVKMIIAMRLIVMIINYCDLLKL